MRNSALQERRNRQILADIVRAYIETGEPVSSRAISKAFEESLSPASIRNVMADLEDAGFLYQPHTSAGRVPTAAAYRFFAQEIASQATITAVDREWIQREMGGATSAAEITERAGHVLAEVSNGLGIIVSPPLGKTVLEHARMWLLPDGRVVVVLISPGGNTRDKILRPNRLFTQGELDATADFLNRHYSGWTLEAIRSDLLQKLATERERYEGMAQSALTLCDPAVLGDESAMHVHVEGAAQIIGAAGFLAQEKQESERQGSERQSQCQQGRERRKRRTVRRSAGRRRRFGESRCGDGQADRRPRGIAPDPPAPAGGL